MMLTAKETAKQVIDRLPEQATWDDILYELYVKQKIEAGLAAAARAKRSPTRTPNGACWMAGERWAEPALADLALQRDYSWQHSPIAARRFVEQCFESVGMLAQFPRRGRSVPERTTADIPAS